MFQAIPNAYKPKKLKAEDRPYNGTAKSGYVTATEKGEQGWRGDITGRPLNRNAPSRKAENPGVRVFPRKLSVSGKKRGGANPLPGTGYQSASRNGENKPIQRSLPSRIPVEGASVGVYSGDIKLRNATPRLRDQGEAFTGFLRAWPSRTPTSGALDAGSFKGLLKARHLHQMRDQGEEFSGFRRTVLRRPLPRTLDVGGYTGDIKLRKALHQMRDQGEEFTGFSRSSRPITGGGSMNGRVKNNGNMPRALDVGGYTGNMKLRKAFHQMRDQGEEFTGFSRSSRPITGGGSINGRVKNNGNIPRALDVGGYTGDIKLRKAHHRMRDQGEEFTGFNRSSRPIAGGGSISRGLRNNPRNALAVRPPSLDSRDVGSYTGSMRLRHARPAIRNQGEEFTGFMKARKPAKGGGSISGNRWNNNGQSIEVRTPLYGTDPNDAGQIKRDYAYMRSPKSNGEALMQKKPTNSLVNVNGLQVLVKRANYLQNVKANQNAIKKKEPSENGFAAQGLLVKVRLYYAYIQNSKSAKEALKKKEPSKSVFLTQGLQVRVRQDFGYIQNPKASPSSMKKREPDKDAFAAQGLQVKVKRNYNLRQNPKANSNSLIKHEPDKAFFALARLRVKVLQKKYGTKPEAKEGSLSGVKPSAATVRASEFQGRMKQLWSFMHNPSSNQAALDVHKPNSMYARVNTFQGRTRLTRNYIRNPKSDKDALMVLAPGKAYAKINNYQGNVKMSKPHRKNLHPDAKFAHGYRDNVKSERTFLMNVKLWWAKLFKKNDNQTEAVKEKVRRPRYDKKEKELWKDLYD
ncbi:MAG: hypothetical protein ACKOE5_03900 [Cytophagales bacterium]